MRLLFVADGRSPTALNWINYFIQIGDDVHLVSTYPCEQVSGLASFQVIPVGFSQAYSEGKLAGRSSLLRRALPVGIRTRLRQWLVPFTFVKSAKKLSMIVNKLKPDLVHSMRIPFEGMLTTEAFKLAEKDNNKIDIPLMISVWGNDFTLHANSTPWMAEHTRQTLHQADALHTDCQRDQRLAKDWGYAPDKPTIVLPGGGGIRLEVFSPGDAESGERKSVVINPRGFRAYVRNDTFFQAIPRVLEGAPGTHFLCPTMQTETQAKKWVAEYEIGDAVELLPFQTRQQMAELYRQAQVVVSLTTHDGTPNTLLEALACGCFPVVGDLESLREWIRDGENGLLVDPGKPDEAAEAILQALSNAELRSRVAVVNQEMIRERAEYRKVMGNARGFYQRIIEARNIQS